METKPVKLLTSITSFQDVQRSLQEIEKVLNELQKSTNPAPEIEMKETDGKPGDLRVTTNTDKTNSLEVKTSDGWKIATVQKQRVTFIDKEAAIVQVKKQTIDEIEAEDTSKGTSIANKTVYDEKAGKFVLPRPDYTSSWTPWNSVTLTHTLETVNFSNVAVFTSSSESYTGAHLNAVVHIAFTNTSTFTMSNLPGSGYYKIKVWK